MALLGLGKQHDNSWLGVAFTKGAFGHIGIDIDIGQSSKVRAGYAFSAWRWVQVFVISEVIGPTGLDIGKDSL